MDYEQDYSRLTAADNKWYEDIISNDDTSETVDKVSDAEARNDGNYLKKTCVTLDNEDFN